MRKPEALYFTRVVRIDKGGVALIGHRYADEEKDERWSVANSARHDFRQ